MIQVIIINCHYDPQFDTPPALLSEYFSLTGWAEGLAQAGATVTVFQRFQTDQELEQADVTFRFVSDAYGPGLRGWQHPWRLYREVAALSRNQRPVVIHINGLIYPFQTFVLRRFLASHSALVVQHHAEAPWPSPRQVLQGWALRSADGFLFAVRDLAEPWLRRGVIKSGQNVYEVMETSSALTQQDRAAARALTGLRGNPVVLWTGSLSHRKDPLTVLAGFDQILVRFPEARLYMAYLHTDLLTPVKSRLKSSPRLSQAVSLLGAVPYAEIGPYYNSADLFVQGSHSEGSGIAVLDALACGVLPIITDIPSFRMMTNGGKIGALWSPGSAEAFVAAFLKVMKQPFAPLAAEALRYFEANWHFSAIGRRAMSIYDEVLTKRTGAKADLL